MFTIQPERLEDAALIEDLHHHAFGPGRFARTGFLLRDDKPHELALSATAWQDGDLVGSIRFNTIQITAADGTAAPALLLGPLAVIRARQGNGLGLSLVKHGLEAAKALGHDLVILIGDPGYYAKAGFERIAPYTLNAGVPLDQQRMCWVSLSSGFDTCPAGRIKPV